MLVMLVTNLETLKFAVFWSDSFPFEQLIIAVKASALFLQYVESIFTE